MAPTRGGGGNSGKDVKQQQSPKKARVARYLKSVEPQLVEHVKSTLLFKGLACSNVMDTLLKEVRAISAPHAKLLTKKNQIVAFDDAGHRSMEFLCRKNDCAILAMATHNKKRPHNVILGRTFDHVVLDLCELGVTYFKSMQDYGGAVPKKKIGSKPLLCFVGEQWQQNSDLRELQNVLIDFYRGVVVDQLVVSGLDHVMVFTATVASVGAPHGAVAAVPRIHQRTYYCKLKKGPHATPTTTTTTTKSSEGAATAPPPPIPLLLPCGPDLDLVLRRTQWASPDLAKMARTMPAKKKQRRRAPPEAAAAAATTTAMSQKTRTKNQNTNVLGETMGRLHVPAQHVQDSRHRKIKALRRAEQVLHGAEQAAVERELSQEAQQEGL